MSYRCMCGGVRVTGPAAWCLYGITWCIACAATQAHCTLRQIQVMRPRVVLQRRCCPHLLRSRDALIILLRNWSWHPWLRQTVWDLLLTMWAPESWWRSQHPAAAHARTHARTHACIHACASTKGTMPRTLLLTHRSTPANATSTDLATVVSCKLQEADAVILQSTLG